MPLGWITINSISKLNRVRASPVYALPNAPTLADLEDTDDEEGNGGWPEKPHLDVRSLVFELDPCGGNGKVCLVYKDTKPGMLCDTSSPRAVCTNQPHLQTPVSFCLCGRCFGLLFLAPYRCAG
ncbi:tubulin polyglutamylase complex subunit 2-like [Podarcis raffonei]|uniref:tubulin polyglutamylase complex subunit 2-like n=1 Tax=Podarcis raffonei TaxID=65483 RepID=UPI00232923F8|nr:tubulin polyglutamylase complex subunit 2-like [Podarcis raffonei]